MFMVCSSEKRIQVHMCIATLAYLNSFIVIQGCKMSIPPILIQFKDASLMAWLKLKITFLLEDFYRFMKNQARNSWLRFCLSVKAALTLASFSCKVRNKRAILVGLASVAALIFTWKLHRHHRIKPCPAPKETYDHESCGSSVKSLHESVSSGCQLVGSEDTFPEGAVQQDLHVTHCETTALCLTRTHEIAIGSRDYVSSKCADEMDTLVFEKRQIQESLRDTKLNQIYPISRSIGSQAVDIGKQRSFTTPSSESTNHWEALSPPGSLKTEPLLHQMRKGDSQKILGSEFSHVPTSTLNSGEPHDDFYMMKSVHNLEVLLLRLHDKDLKEGMDPFRISNSTQNENIEVVNKALDVHKNVQTSSGTTSSDMTNSNFVPIELTTIQNYANQDSSATKIPAQLHSTTYAGFDNENSSLHPYSHNKNNVARDIIDIPCTIQSTVPNNNINLFITGFPDIGSRSVRVMVGEHTEEDFKYENKASLSQPIDATESLHHNAWYDSELISRIPPDKLDRSIHQGVDMYKLVDVTRDDDRNNCDLKIPQGSYQEKIHTYDKYLADPKLSAQMRSQVQRAKIYLQRYYELDGR